ncbi:MAG: alpha/beta hydrolase, partial [Planctomycetaceae bacterium]|nr:alpha/beta hydrolase [Planctomycetaceae bacterium]
MRLLIKCFVTGILVMLTCSTASAENTHLLWPEGAPGALGTAAKDQPKITVYLPAEKEATG